MGKKGFFRPNQVSTLQILGAAHDSHLPPLGDEEAALSLHRGVRRVCELQVVLTDLRFPMRTKYFDEIETSGFLSKRSWRSSGKSIMRSSMWVISLLP